MGALGFIELLISIYLPCEGVRHFTMMDNLVVALALFCFFTKQLLSNWKATIFKIHIFTNKKQGAHWLPVFSL